MPIKTGTSQGAAIDGTNVHEILDANAGSATSRRVVWSSNFTGNFKILSKVSGIIGWLQGDVSVDLTALEDMEDGTVGPCSPVCTINTDSGVPTHTSFYADTAMALYIIEVQ